MILRHLVHAIAIIVVLGTALFLRGWRLGSWPVFIDEDEYGTATRSISHAGFFRGFKLPAREVDKPVLLFWVREALWPMCGSPVMAGRWISAISGVVCCWMCYLIGRRVAGPVAGLVAALVYGTSPWAILQDRQNIHDPAMTALLLASLVMLLRQIDRPTVATAVTATLLGALAVFAKPSAVLLFAAPAVAYLSFGKRPWDRRWRWPVVAMSTGPLVTFLVLRYGHLGASTDRFAPLSRANSNLSDFFDAARCYTGPGVLILAIAGLGWLWQNRRGGFFLYAALVVGWTTIWIILGDFAPSRYYLPTVALVAVLAGVGARAVIAWASSLSSAAGVCASGLIVAALTGPFIHSFDLLTNYRDARMSRLDDWQYRSSWAAGYAYRDADAWLRQHAAPPCRIAYLVDLNHREASGMFNGLPSGAISLGNFASPDQLSAQTFVSPTLVMISDARSGSRAAENQVLAKFNGSREVARFLNPGYNWGVSIIELPVAANSTRSITPAVSHAV